MREIALIDASVEAFGHPSNCTEPVSGSVESTNSNNITVTSSGQTKEIASVDSADISIPSHAHDYSLEEGCHNSQSHTVDATGESSITINGSPIYIIGDDEATDPITGGNININDNTFDTEIYV